MEKQLGTTEAADAAEAFAFCIKNRLYGAKYFTDAVVHYEKHRLSSATINSLPSEPIIEPPQRSKGTLNIQVPIRDISVYQRVMEGALR
jgi:hypothetical protein